MTPESNKAALVEVLDLVFAQGKAEAFRDFSTPDVVFHLAGVPHPYVGAEAVTEWARQFLAGWEAELTIKDVIAEGDKVAARWLVRGIHRGDYQGMPPTGNAAEFTQLYLARFVGGKVAEVWITFDTLGVVRQLGFFPKGPPPRNLLRFVIWLRGLGRTKKAKPVSP